MVSARVPVNHPGESLGSAGSSLRAALGGLALVLGGKWVPVSPAEAGGGQGGEDPLLTMK